MKSFYEFLNLGQQQKILNLWYCISKIHSLSLYSKAKYPPFKKPNNPFTNFFLAVKINRILL